MAQPTLRTTLPPRDVHPCADGQRAQPGGRKSRGWLCFWKPSDVWKDLAQLTPDGGLDLRADEPADQHARKTWMAGPSPRRSGFGRAGGSSPAMTSSVSTPMVGVRTPRSIVHFWTEILFENSSGFTGTRSLGSSSLGMDRVF